MTDKRPGGETTRNEAVAVGPPQHALVVELVDTLVLGTSAYGHEGSSPSRRTTRNAVACTFQAHRQLAPGMSRWTQLVWRPGCQPGEAGSIPVTCARLEGGSGSLIDSLLSSNLPLWQTRQRRDGCPTGRRVMGV